MIRATLYLGTKPEGTSGLRLSLDPVVVVRQVEEIAHHLARLGIEGATITPSFGLWKGELEPSFRIEILAAIGPAGIQSVADALARHFGQAAVLFTIDIPSITELTNALS